MLNPVLIWFKHKVYLLIMIIVACMKVEVPRTDLHEVTEQGGASQADLEPNEKQGLRGIAIG